jgi:HicB-like protein involved in pilus formation
MPAGLHGELARAADREGVSLNQFISSALAGVVGWGREDGAVPASTPTPKGRSRWLMVLLAANLVLVAAAAVTAIVYLVAAWLTG